MQPNPYQSPAGAPPSAPNLLRLPAFGCIILGILAIVPSLFLLAGFGYLLVVEYLSPYGVSSDNLQIARMAITDGVLGVTFALAAFVMARAMFTRKYRWLIVLGALLGSLLIVPAQVTVLILMRIRRKEVWDSFNHAL